MLFIKVIKPQPHTRCLISIKGSEARLGCMGITHTAQNYSELDFGGLQRTDNSASDDQQTQINIRQDDQFCLCDVKYNKTEQE